MTKVLIVDDEEEMIKYLPEMLKEKGFDVIMCSNAKDAIEVYSKEKPNIVLLDLSLPDADGRSVLKDIKNKNTDTKVIVISGHSDPAIRRELKKIGADDFLGKPVIPTKIVDTLLNIGR